MAPKTPTNLEKAAILLRRLPPPSLTRVLEMIGLQSAEKLKEAISSVGARADLGELDEQVLQEFREMQREVRESLRGSPHLEMIHSGSTMNSQEGPTVGSASILSSSGLDGGAPGPVDADIVRQLTSLAPEILAAALKQETLQSTALVLRELPTEFTGRVLEKMPMEQRQKLFMLLALKSTVHREVVKKVLHAVMDVCKTINLSSLSEEQQDGRFKTLIGILQMVEREERLRLMEALTEQDEELAAQIDDSLYDYSDLLRIQDRSVQKLLTQLELKVVAMALKTAPEEIVSKVMVNLSERVRGTLTEEMELLGTVPAAKIEQARREIANVVRLQDKDGTLQWIE